MLKMPMWEADEPWNLTSTVLFFASQVVIFVLILAFPGPPTLLDLFLKTHYKLGLSNADETGLRSQYRPEHGYSEGKPARIQSLFIYPVKSCQGIELKRSKVLPSGLEYDRLYTFAQLKPNLAADSSSDEDGEVWQFLTQRQLPLLANVKVDVLLPEPSKAKETQDRVEGHVLVSFPQPPKRDILTRFVSLLAIIHRDKVEHGEKQIVLPLDIPSEEAIKSKGYSYANVKIWKETITALNMENELPEELALYLGVTSRLGLFRSNPEMQRKVFRCAPTKEAAGFQPVVDFHDAYPLHLLSLSSIQDLESVVTKDSQLQNLDARRFRANMIGETAHIPGKGSSLTGENEQVTGTKAYAEDSWKLITCSSEVELSHFDVSCRTARCKLPNVDPSNGIRHRVEPDRSLRKYREVDAGAPKNGCLGMQLCPLFPEAKDAAELVSYVEVGMRIEVLEEGEHLYIAQ